MESLEYLKQKIVNKILRLEFKNSMNKRLRYLRKKAKYYAKNKMLEYWAFCDNLLFWHQDTVRILVDSGIYEYAEAVKLCDHACGYDIPYVAYKLGKEVCYD